jgi:hypothetical protein
MKLFLHGMKLIAAIFLSLISLNTASAAVFSVTKTVDDGSAGTLRWAITQANATAGADVITFNILDLIPNTFQGTIPNRYAVITLGSALPTITQAVTIDGTTQLNLNTGIMAGKVVGVDGHVQPSINYPDVYIVCGYTLPTDESGLNGNGINVNAANVTIQGIAISGFGNTNTSQPAGVSHADITIVRAAAARSVNVNINQCFVSYLGQYFWLITMASSSSIRGGALP